VQISGHFDVWIIMDQVYQKFGPFRPGSFDGLPGILFSPSPSPGPRKLGQLQDTRVMAEVLGRVCYFIFVHLAVPLLRGHFYATEAVGKNTKKTSQPGWAPQVGNAFNGGTIMLNCCSVGFVFFSALPDVVPQSLLVDVYELV